MAQNIIAPRPRFSLVAHFCKAWISLVALGVTLPGCGMKTSSEGAAALSTSGAAPQSTVNPLSGITLIQLRGNNRSSLGLGPWQSWAGGNIQLRLSESSNALCGYMGNEEFILNVLPLPNEPGRALPRAVEARALTLVVKYSALHASKLKFYVKHEDAQRSPFCLFGSGGINDGQGNMVWRMPGLWEPGNTRVVIATENAGESVPFTLSVESAW